LFSASSKLLSQLGVFLQISAGTFDSRTRLDLSGQALDPIGAGLFRGSHQ
jgi:hypothetical protein